MDWLIDEYPYHIATCRMLAAQTRARVDRSKWVASSAASIIAGLPAAGSPVAPDASLPVEREPDGTRHDPINRERLLQWEAADLSELIPGEMHTPRRRFAVALYETIAMARSLGMDEGRLLFHVRSAIERYDETA